MHSHAIELEDNVQSHPLLVPWKEQRVDSCVASCCTQTELIALALEEEVQTDSPFVPWLGAREVVIADEEATFN